jgi:LPS sulfotransferase NodH
LSTPRTGSTYLVALFNGHPETWCYQELFIARRNLENKNLYSSYIRNSVRNRLESIFSPSSSIKKYLNQMHPNNDHVLGCKIMTSQIRKNISLVSILKEEGYKVIKLKRRNLIKQYVSLKSAQQSDYWHSDIPIDIKKIHLSTFGLVRNLKRIESENALMNKWFDPTVSLEIYYEDLVGEKAELTMEKIVDFLELEKSITNIPDLIKLLPENLEDVVVNFHEVQNALIKSNCFDRERIGI